MLDESFFTADGSEESQEATPAPVPIGMYRRWLSQIFEHEDLSPASLAQTQDSPLESWIMVDRIKREDKVFEDIWDPNVSGDWSAIIQPPVLRSPSDLSPRVGDVPHDEVDDSRLSEVFRWAFKTEDVDPVERDLDRIELWRKAGKSLAPDKGLTYLDYVMTEIHSTVVDAIALDVERTMPEYLQTRMTRVLQAYAARNPSVGFCQGMSYIVSALLQNEWMTDEDAFTILCGIIEGINMEYYNNSLSGLHMDLRRLTKFLFYVSETPLPIPIELVLVEPMICVFTRVVPIENSSRMLDIALTQGKVGMFSVYLALIELLLPSLESIVNGSESPSMGLVNGAVAFKLAMIELLTNECDTLIRRAEGFLLSHRSYLEALVNEDIDADTEFVPSWTSRAPIETTRGTLFERLRAKLSSIMDSDDEDSFFSH